VALTAVNCLGVGKTAALTRVLVALVLAALALVVVTVWSGEAADTSHLWPIESAGPFAILQSAGFLFFAFAGYARIATLGEEVVDPERTIPRAIPIALFLALAVYVVIGISALAGAGAAAIAASDAPLVTAVEAGRFARAAPIVRIGAVLASLSVLLALIAGVGRTIFAMASNADLPRWFSAVHARHRVPHRAEIGTGLIVIVLVVLADVRTAIGFSSFAVLVYYAVANASAWTLAPKERLWPRCFATAGLVGCLLLTFTLPPVEVLAGCALLAAGLVVHLLRGKRRSP
jgi:APA family basic amino acid/polyamine antiporter